MAIPLDEFQRAKSRFFSLEPLETDSDGWVTAIAVTIEGIRGSKNSRRDERVQYRLLASVGTLRQQLPQVWIVSPSDNDIGHANIFHARAMCPFTGRKLPDICWGHTPQAWHGTNIAERTLANFLEAVQQVLNEVYFGSAAR